MEIHASCRFIDLFVRLTSLLSFLSASGLAVTLNWKTIHDDIYTNWNIAQIDAGISTDVWAIDREGKAHVKSALNAKWIDLENSEKVSLSWVSSGAAGVWGIKKEYGEPVFRTGVTQTQPLGKSWVNTEGRDFRIVESGLVGNVFGLTRQGKLYYRDQITDENLKGTSWREIWGSFRYVSAGSYGVWIIDLFGELYFAKGNHQNISKISGWQNVKSSPKIDFASVITGFDGSVWALSKTGGVYQRTGVNIINATGDPYWKRIDGLKLRQLTVGLPGVIGITGRNQVIAFQGQLKFMLI